MTELVTVDSIIAFLQNAVETKTPVAPEMWLDAARKLNVLRADEDDRLAELAVDVNRIKVQEMETGKSAAAAKAVAEASDTYLQYLKQSSRCERIAEFIRIEKIRARLSSDEMRGQY